MSSMSQRHTLEDLETLSQGGEPKEIAAALGQQKGGLNPVHLSVLLAAIQSGQVLRLLAEMVKDQTGDQPTQADRIEALLETLVGALEAQAARDAARDKTQAGRHSEIMSALAKLSVR